MGSSIFYDNEPLQDVALQVGQQVRHAKFGEGVILAAEGKGDHTRVQVNFYDVGMKWLVLAYANLQPA